MLDIPEHLPSSPLCPMHPKHKSGGKGICPFHGRRRVDEETASTRMKGTGGSVTGAAREGRMRVDDFRTLKSVPAEIPED